MGTKRRRVKRVRRTVPTKSKPKVIESIVEELDGDVCVIEPVVEVVPEDGDRLFKVCFDWDLRIPDYVFNVTRGELDKFKNKVALMPYSHLLMRKLYDAGYGAWCVQSALEYTTKDGLQLKKVVEYCAGVGRVTTIIQNLLSPDKHYAMDISPVLCKHLQQAFPNVFVECWNYIEKGFLKGMDLSCIDNNSFTIHKFLNPKFGQKEFIINVVKGSKFTLITDTAKSRLHLNKERYADLLNAPIQSEYDYLMAFSHKMYELAGASIVFAASHPRASYMLFQKVEPIEFELVHPEESAKDYFQLVDGERPITVREEHVKEPIVEVIEAVEEVEERPEEPEQEEDVETSSEGAKEDDSEIKRMMKKARTSRTKSTEKNDSNIPQDNIPDIEDEDIFDGDSDLKVAIVMAGGGAAGKSTASKAFAIGDPVEKYELGRWYDRNDVGKVQGVNVTLYDNYALTGNHKSGTDANQAPDLVRLAAWRALGERDIIIVDGMVSSPQWVSMLNNWPGETPLHVLLVHFDLPAETLMDRLASRRGKDKETFRERMYPKCEGLVRRAELLVGHFEDDCKRPMEKLVVDELATPEEIVEAMDDMLHYIYDKYDLDYDIIRS